MKKARYNAELSMIKINKGQIEIRDIVKIFQDATWLL